MSILGVNGALAGVYQYANMARKTGTSNSVSFTEQLQKTREAADASKVDAYTEYLKSKYGNVRIQSIGKDKQSLDRAGKSMSGSDVVTAPNILEQMANDPEKAAYYEGKIDDFFNATPRLKAQFAAQGLDYQPCGVVVHEDGSVTYISGCADSPKRVAAKLIPCPPARCRLSYHKVFHKEVWTLWNIKQKGITKKKMVFRLPSHHSTRTGSPVLNM